MGDGTVETTDRPKESNVQWLLWLALFLLTGSVLFFLSRVDFHRHVLEVNTPAGGFRIISNRSSFRVSLPGVRDVQLISLRGYDGFTRNGSTIVPVQVEGVGFIRTWQHVDLPANPPEVVFYFNEHEFRIEGGKVQAAGQVWDLKPGAVVDVLVDHLRE
jgi:hypothetical protein